MNKQDQPHWIAKAIFDAYGNADEQRRAYMGPSGAHDALECKLKGWMRLRSAGYDSASARVKKLWEHGHSEEARLLAALRRAGVQVIDRDPGGGQVRVAHKGTMIRGSIDALVRRGPNEPWVLADPKTASAKRFREYKKHGVSKFQGYRTQQQLYLGMLITSWAELQERHPELKGSAPPREFALIFSNKDDDDLHIYAEPFDPEYYKATIATLLDVIDTQEPPAPLASEEFTCKFCQGRDICHGEAPWREVCGTCVNFEQGRRFASCARLKVGVKGSAAACGFYEAHPKPAPATVLSWGE